MFLLSKAKLSMRAWAKSSLISRCTEIDLHKNLQYLSRRSVRKLVSAKISTNKVKRIPKKSSKIPMRIKENFKSAQQRSASSISSSEAHGHSNVSLINGFQTTNRYMCF